MTTYKVANQSQFKSALNSAKSGDNIVMKAGNYGNVTISNEKFSSKVTISSESSSNPATFTKLYMTNSSNITFKGVEFDYTSSSGSTIPFNVKSSSNLTFDNVTFDGLTQSGHGTGVGLKVYSSSNVTVQNSDFVNFNKGMETWNNTNFKLLNNDFNNIAYDGVVVGHSKGVLIQGNEINIRNAVGDNHRDVIQFYNQGSKAPSSDVTIKGNVLTADNGITHGIFFGNNDARGGGSSEFYKNVTIEGNTIKTGQVLALAMGGAQNVSIKKNIVIQNEDFYSKKTVNIPMILIDKDAKGVSVSGNTVVKAPAIADDSSNWKIIGTLSNTGSKIVALGAKISSATALADTADATTLSASATTATTAAAATTSTTASSAATSLSSGNGLADEFRFKGTDLSGGDKTSKIAADFSDGDTIVLINYAKGTFEDVSGGNVLHNSADGTYVKIDSVTDLRELASSSDAISAKVSGDTLTLDVAQASGTHHLVFEGLGHAFQADTTLF